ncbi:MAG TPA: hypothetical protein PL066_00585 [bacterium]|nr:hypothetical protein [bacterium]
MYDFKNSITVVLKVTAIVLLVLALFPLPIWYYNILRLIICGLSIYFATLVYNEHEKFWTGIFVIIMLVYNPLYPFYLSKDMWIVIYIVSIAFIIFTVYKFDLPKIKKYTEQEKVQIRQLSTILKATPRDGISEKLLYKLKEHNIPLNKITALCLIGFNKDKPFQYELFLLNNISEFSGLDMEVATKLIGFPGDEVFAALNYFNRIDYTKLFLFFLETTGGFDESRVGKFLNTIPNYSLTEEAIGKIFYKLAVNYVEKFNFSAQNVLVEKMLNNSSFISNYDLETVLRQATNLNENLLFKYLELELYQDVLENLDHFNINNYKKVLSFFVENNKEKLLDGYMDKFKGLTLEDVK